MYMLKMTQLGKLVVQLIILWIFKRTIWFNINQTRVYTKCLISQFVNLSHLNTCRQYIVSLQNVCIYRYMYICRNEFLAQVRKKPTTTCKRKTLKHIQSTFDNYSQKQSKHITIFDTWQQFTKCFCVTQESVSPGIALHARQWTPRWTAVLTKSPLTANK